MTMFDLKIPKLSSAQSLLFDERLGEENHSVEGSYTAVTTRTPTSDWTLKLMEDGQQQSYVHREGTRQYLETTVLPHVRAALTALLHKMQQERLELAAGNGLDEGFLPKDWRPFCAQEWLADYLLQHKPASSVKESDQHLEVPPAGQEETG